MEKDINIAKLELRPENMPHVFNHICMLYIKGCTNEEGGITAKDFLYHQAALCAGLSTSLAVVSAFRVEDVVSGERVRRQEDVDALQGEIARTIFRYWESTRVKA